MTGFLLQICATDRLSSLALDEYHQLTHTTHRALVARASAAAARLWRRRGTRPPSTPLHKRRLAHGFHSLERILQRRLEMASHQEIRRRSSVADRTSVEPSLINLATTTTIAAVNIPSPIPDAPLYNARSRANTGAMHPPPRPSDEAAALRKPRVTSINTRNANRLSLTLPIALPTSDPSRPTPAPLPSVPATPVDVSDADSPSDANEFIIAIAAQERKVLELREELTRAEAELLSLKRQWTLQEGRQKRNQPGPGELQRSNTIAGDTPTSSKRIAEVDRRKLILQGQSTPTTPGRRRVMRGGHARTLSLLSPTKSDYSDQEDDRGHVQPLPLERKAPQLPNLGLSKRASWQPQSYHSAPGVPSFVEEFRLGLRSFVEDIRQITVGDEPISGQAPRSSPGSDESPYGQDTIRATPATRPKVSNAFDLPPSATGTPTPSSKGADATQEKPKTGRTKHFSWTPLSYDALDDNGWSNWESPASTKSSRWSGSTINSNSGDVESVDCTARTDRDSGTPQRKKKATMDTPLLSPKLEEILPNMVNRLSPSNIKRTANHLLDEWEKSLTATDGQNKENSI
ncbi:hypothetical protein S40288_09095 [Stachybotrys chartarum IBT 40288]|nr:hypothetical protein S40288_09095 [Stachybotrys chartarum IBT 40288]